MPHPLSTTLLACAFLAVLISGTPLFIVAGVFCMWAVFLEAGRFWINGAEPSPHQREVLVKSGEQIPEEQGRTTLLRG